MVRLRGPKQDLSDRGRIPLRTALRGRHIVPVEAVGDRAKRVAAGALTLYPLHHRLRQRRWGGPRLTPLARLTASGYMERCRDSRRSNFAKVTSMFVIASPVGVGVVTAQSARSAPKNAPGRAACSAALLRSCRCYGAVVNAKMSEFPNLAGHCCWIAGAVAASPFCSA
jgi:hypothetical protein